MKTEFRMKWRGLCKSDNPKGYGIEEDFGFFDIEKLKNLSSKDVKEIQKHIEWIAQKTTIGNVIF